MNEAERGQRSVPGGTEGFYDALTGYGFALRYVKGRSVADISLGRIGYGTRLLAESAGSVTGLTDLTESLELASTIYSAPNVRYQKVDLPDLPYPDDYFDVAVAFEVIEHLEDPKGFLLEAKRILKRGGILILSTPDRQTYSNERNRRDPAHKREMHAPEFREMLERHFESVETYRQGAVAGGLISGPADTLSEGSVETAGFSSASPSLRDGLPATRFVLAVCSDAEIPARETGLPYLLLDGDRRVFDEAEERREDVELMHAEIQRMQETEVQAFRDALKLERSEVTRLKAALNGREADVRRHEDQAEKLEAEIARHEARVKHYEARVRNLEARSEKSEAQNQRLKTRNQRLGARIGELGVKNQKLRQRLHNIESSRTWRLLGLYRRLRGGRRPGAG